MATVSRFRASVSFKGLRLSGFLGWLRWFVVHVTLLTGFNNRFQALLHWATENGAVRDGRPRRQRGVLRRSRRGQRRQCASHEEARRHRKAGQLCIGHRRRQGQGDNRRPGHGIDP